MWSNRSGGLHTTVRRRGGEELWEFFGDHAADELARVRSVQAIPGGVGVRRVGNVDCEQHGHAGEGGGDGLCAGGAVGELEAPAVSALVFEPVVFDLFG